MNLLITGSTGFIGTKLISYLSMNNPEIKFYGWKRSYKKLNEVNFKLQFGNIKIDKVVHLAGHTKVIESWDKPQQYFIENVELTLDSLEFCKQHISDLVFISSYLYGNTNNLPINELEPVELTSPYSYGKHSSENLCKFYSDNFNINVQVLRPFNIYGPGQDNYFLLPKIALQIKDDTKDEISIYNLHTKRDFVFINDFCEAIVKALAGKNHYEIINIGSGFSVSTQQIIDEFFKISGKQKRINSAEIYRKNEIMDVVADINKAKSYLGWQSKTSINEGLKNLYENL
ncbi:MAG: NAD-dependent epimerase/dehydratase family protein [Bacteroidia bacterium]